MSVKSITVRMDDALKSQFEDRLDDMGLNMTTAVTLFAKAVVRQGKIPFEIATNTPNEETFFAMLETEQLLNDPDAKTYDSVAELFADLEAECTG